MPFASHDGTRIYWKLQGSDDKPALVLLNSIGTDMSVWDGCIDRLLPDFRILRLDTRGHGASDAPGGEYSLPEMARDVLAVMDSAGIERAHIAGLSLGGMVAMQMALDAPDRVDRLALVCTSATMDSIAWQARIDAVRSGGMEAIAGLAMERFLSAGFSADHPRSAADVRRNLLSMEPMGYAGAAAAIRDMELREKLGEIAAPSLVVSGTQDVATPREPHGKVLASAIPGAEESALECGHLAPIEVPAELAAKLRDFFLPQEQVRDAADALYEAGMLNRRRVLGDEWVDASIAKATPFNADFQAMITRIAWHEIWGRPGLDDRTRRLIVIAITASLSRWEEFALHVRVGLERGGFTRDELKEVLMQTAIYAGVPAANTGFAEAMKIIDEIDGASK